MAMKFSIVKLLIGAILIVAGFGLLVYGVPQKYDYGNRETSSGGGPNVPYNPAPYQQNNTDLNKTVTVGDYSINYGQILGIVLIIAGVVLLLI